MKNTSLDLSKILPNNILQILNDVILVSSEMKFPIFVIGATARDIIMQGIHDIKVPRATDDLDFGVAVKAWEAYERLKKKLIDGHSFRQDERQEQRLWRDEYKIDVVPYGGLESAAGEIAFPPDGDFKMSTAGFPEAFDDAISVSLKERQVRVASLPGIVLLKFIAYHDRPAERVKDIDDILFIAKNYLDAGANEKLYDRDSDLLDEDFDYLRTGARILGRDLAGLMAPDTRTIVFDTLRRLNDRYDASESTGVLLREIKKGIKERI
jgi:predicted nucleotidyltransferase